MRVSKDTYFMGIAKAVSKRSPCLNRQVGCVLLDKNNHIMSTGYNGPPSGVVHCTQCRRSEPGRDLYLCEAVHAEMNALLQCRNTNEIVSAFITINPCMICARLLANTSCEYIYVGGIYTKESMAQFIDFWQMGLQRKVIDLSMGSLEK